MKRLVNAIERRTFDGRKFTFLRADKKDLVSLLSPYLNKDTLKDFSDGSYMTYQICEENGSSDQLLGQDWGCNIFRAVTEQFSGDSLVFLDSIAEFLTQYGAMSRRDWVTAQDDREDWKNNDYTCTVIEVCGKDMEAAIIEIKAEIRAEVEAEFAMEWEWAVSDDCTAPESVYSGAYDKAAEGHNKFYMPSEASINYELGGIISENKDKREDLIKKGWEQALAEKLEELDLD